MTAQIKNNGGSQLDFVLGGIVVATVDETGIKKGVSVAPSLNGVPLFHHNEIVNGDFRIAQIGTSFAAPADTAYDLDGWKSGKAGATVFTVAQVAGSTLGRLARQVAITTADTAVAAGDLVMDVTTIEGSNIEKYVGATFTIAFRAKVPVAGIHCVALRNSGGDRSYVKEINFPVANAWQNCSFTVAGGLPTDGTWNYTNGVGLSIYFAHLCGTNYQTTPDAWNTGFFVATANQVNDCATVGNVWAIEKVTMNLGTVAAVSEISYEQELMRCQRYYQFFKGSQYLNECTGVAANSNNIYFSKPFIVEMRTPPTFTPIGTFHADGTTYLPVALTMPYASPTNARLDGVGSGWTAGQAYSLVHQSVNSILSFSARL